jgi:hypothetical protein
MRGGGSPEPDAPLEPAPDGDVFPCPEPALPLFCELVLSLPDATLLLFWEPALPVFREMPPLSGATLLLFLESSSPGAPGADGGDCKCA